MTPPTLGNLPPELIDQVIAEAAAIASVSESEVSIVRAEAVVWSDGSLGCPEPGQFYTQALVDGYWLVLRAGGQDYDFRASRGGEFRLCPPGQGRPPVEP